MYDAVHKLLQHIEKVLSHAEEVVATDDWWADKLDDGEESHDLHKEKPIP